MTFNVYVDGSFNQKNNRVGWAYVIEDERSNKVGYFDSGFLDTEIISMRQVGGELKAVIQALVYIKKFNAKMNVYYDYEGIYKWVDDAWLAKKKPSWRAKNEWTKKYREFIIDNKKNIARFEHVKAHTGIELNEVVDRLAKEACGINSK